MRDLGFSASAWVRGLVGVGFCVAAVALVWVIERPRSSAEAPRMVVQPSAHQQQYLLMIESTYLVAEWSVSILNHEQLPAHRHAYTWTGTLSAEPGSEILIVATAKPDEVLPNRGLRISLGGAPPKIVWGGGDVTATIVVPPEAPVSP